MRASDRGQQRSTREARDAERAMAAVDARLPLAESGRALLRKPFPDHATFFFGELALYSFLVLLVTGVYLTLFFDPSMTESPYDGAYRPLQGGLASQAYASTLHISFEVRGGLLVRQTHHWAALVFVAAIGVHLLRVFFTGAFRRPRELNWVIGVTLFLLALVEGFAGYSLPDDLLSGTGLRTAQGIVLSVPVVGSYLSFFLFGGEFPSESIDLRLYPVHILLVPGLLLALITVHLILVAYLKHTQWPGPGYTRRSAAGVPMVPQFAAKSAGLSLMVGGVLFLMGGLVQINPVWTYGPYRADQVSTDAQPDWYVGFLEGSLRLMPGLETRVAGHTVLWNVFLPAVVLPGLLFLVLYGYPFLERWVSGDNREHHLCDRPRDHPARTALGTGALTGYAVLLLAGGQDVLAYVFVVPVHWLTWVLRLAFVLLPPAACWLTRRLCLALQARDRDAYLEGRPTGWVRQSLEGAYHPQHASMSGRERYVLAARSLPPGPPVGPSAGAGRVERLRVALATWYYRDRVELPVTDRDSNAKPATPAASTPEASRNSHRP